MNVIASLTCWIFGHYWCFRVGQAGKEYGTMEWGRCCGICDAFKPDRLTRSRSK